MSNHTPTTAEVCFRYAEFPYVSQIKDEPGDPAEFYRWLAKHDAEVSAKVRAEQAAIIEAAREYCAQHPWMDIEPERVLKILSSTPTTSTTPVSKTRKEQN